MWATAAAASPQEPGKHPAFCVAHGCPLKTTAFSLSQVCIPPPPGFNLIYTLSRKIHQYSFYVQTTSIFNTPANSGWLIGAYKNRNRSTSSCYSSKELPAGQLNKRKDLKLRSPASYCLQSLRILRSLPCAQMLVTLWVRKRESLICTIFHIV